MMRSAWLLASLLLTLTVSAFPVSAAPAPEDVLKAMEASERSIDRFSCHFTTTWQLHGKFKDHDVAKGKRPDFQALPPSEWPPAKKRESDITVEDDKFRLEMREQRSNRLVTEQESWDGKQRRSHRIGSNELNMTALPLVRSLVLSSPAFV